MTERPIIFSGPMVRAILAGRKTVTRRVVKADSSQLHGDGPVAICPYGQPGDRLWVREAHALPSGMQDKSKVLYRADETDLHRSDAGFRWSSPIHMPRWASRITLEVVDVRVERLQEISEADAEAEGVVPQDRYIEPPVYETTHASYRLGFQVLWDSINGKTYPWSSNPWVWRVEFKRVEAA